MMKFLLSGSLVPEFTAPQVPDAGLEFMPEKAESFAEGFWELIGQAAARIRPDLAQAAEVCVSVVAVIMLLSILRSFCPGAGKTVELAGAAGIALMLMERSGSLIRLAGDTVVVLSDYGKLLLGVMTSVLAAQGGTTTAAGLYVGTTMFSSLLSSLAASVLIPLIYMFLALCVANAATGEDILRKIASLLKWLATWGLKIILYLFTGYISITGVVSGATDAAVLKAAKLTISGVVPVVGGILADASEAVLVSAGIIRNSAGIYGIFAVLSLCIGPFLQIGCHYLLLKATGAAAAVFADKRISGLIGDFSVAMGLLFAMTGSVCILLLVGTVCFLRGVG